MITWLLINWNLNPKIIGIGFLLSLTISYLLCGSCKIFSGIKLTLTGVFYSFVYLLVFIRELIKANIDITKRVLSPSMPINPGIVKVKVKLRSKFGRLILANSITLTPGTFTLQIDDEYFYIHWINVEAEDIQATTEAIVFTFEKYLLKLYE
jgi:multicomponent Na+:H+ antiporter subunit E